MRQEIYKKLTRILCNDKIISVKQTGKGAVFMGVRFRRSVKICKGARVNFSKSGASLSLGGRGRTLTVGPRGTRMTVGIPGTGLSYSFGTSRGKSRKRKRKKSSSSSRGSRGTRSGTGGGAAYIPVHKEFIITMNQDGKVRITDKNENEITDAALLRKIKSTDEYKKTVKGLDEKRRKKLDEEYEKDRAYNARFVEIYKLSPKVLRREDYRKDYDDAEAFVYVREKYDVARPTARTVRAQLWKESKAMAHGNFLAALMERKEYVDRNLRDELDRRAAEWEREKAGFDAQEERNYLLAAEKHNSELSEKRRYLTDLLSGEDEPVCEAVEMWISSCELPVEINVDYEWRRYEYTMYLDVDLPEIEDLPESETIRLASGNLREKKKTQAKLKEEYLDLVFGLAVFISANIFNVSPAISKIVISGYTQRRNKDGDLNDEYVYSIKFTRDLFETTQLQSTDPRDFCMKFENRCNITSSLLMKKITPFE